MYSGEKTIMKASNSAVAKTIMFEFAIPSAERFSKTV